MFLAARSARKGAPYRTAKPDVFADHGLAVAATSPRNAAADTYGAADAVDSPPAQTAPRATTTAAAAAPTKKKATSATAAAAARATTTAAAASAAATAAAMATAATATSDELDARLERAGVFFVEDIEGRQTHVGNLFLTEKDLLPHVGILRRRL
jgi:hypothetical protein